MPNRYHRGNPKARVSLPRRVTHCGKTTFIISRMVTRIGPKHAFKHYIQEWREDRKLTQEQLANRIESTKASISRWETGERDPTMKVLAAIAYALKIDIGDIFRHPKQPSADQLLRHQSQATQEKAVELVKVYLKAS